MLNPVESDSTANQMLRGAMPASGSKLVDALRCMNATLACLDLDLTLVNSPEFYTELEILTCARFGYSDKDATRALHKKLQALSGDEIMRGHYDSAGGQSKLGCSFDEFNGYFHALVEQAKDGTLNVSMPQLEIPGARQLVETVRDCAISYQITTGSRPNVARTLLDSSGLRPFFSEEQIVCAGGSEFEKKSHPKFWEKALGGHDPARCAGFEDHPDAVRWMLAAGFGRVFLRPPEVTPEVRNLVAEEPRRVVLVEDWRHILAAA